MPAAKTTTWMTILRSFVCLISGQHDTPIFFLDFDAMGQKFSTPRSSCYGSKSRWLSMVFFICDTAFLSLIERLYDCYEAM